MVHVVQPNTDICSLILIHMCMPSHFHTQETHYYHQYHHHHTSSLHTPVRVCSFGIEAAIAMHASPSFCIAVTDNDTGDGADDDNGAIVG